MGNVLRGRTAQLNPPSLWGCPWSGGAGFQLPAFSGWGWIDTSLWLSPSRACRLSSSLPTSPSWTGSCCPLCCSPKAWACSVWLGSPAPALPPSGKSFVHLCIQGRSPQCRAGVCAEVYGGVAGSSSPEAFIVSLLPVLPSQPVGLRWRVSHGS